MTLDSTTDPTVLLRASTEASDAGDLDVALAYARQAADLAHDQAELQNAIGIALAYLGDFETSRRCFERAIALTPSKPDGYLNLGRLCLDKLDRPDDAAQLYRRAIGLAPQVMAGYLGLCAALVRRGDLEHVLAIIARSGLVPDLHVAYLPIAEALTREGRYGEARICCERLLDARPAEANAHALLGEIAFALREPDHAVRCYERAVELAPTAPATVSGLLRALASLGRLSEAKRLYLAAGEAMSAMQKFRFPAWRGEPLTGKTLFLQTSRGFGDAIQFARYASIARDLGARVIVQTAAAIAPLLRTVGGIDTVILPQDDPGRVDYECDFELFGLVAGITLEDAGRYVPYMAVPEVSAEVGRDAAHGSALRVALTWENRQLYERDPYRNRAIPLTSLRPLCERPGDVEFFAIQKGLGAQQLRRDADLSSRVQAVDRDLRHYGDTAAWLSRMDVVICIDSSIAHLAGALGKPTWLLLSYAADWRWGWHGETSPWYPTARLFRQERPGDWTGPVHAVSQALDQLSRRRHERAGGTAVAR